MTARRSLLVIAALLAVALLAAAAGCGSQPRPGNFTDGFDGEHFPAKGWIFGGPAPVLDTTSGDPAPSMTWTACAGSSGAFAQIDKVFDSAFSFDGQVSFLVYDTSATPGSGVSFHVFGDRGDDAAAAIFPAPGGKIRLEINGQIVDGALPTDRAFHRLEIAVDSVGNAAWLVDGALAFTLAPFESTELVAEFDCREGDSAAGPMPVLFDDVAVHSRPSP